MSVAQYEQHYAGWLGLAENGRIRKTKFVDMMVGSGVDKEMAEILFDTYDADGSGYVSKTFLFLHPWPKTAAQGHGWPN